MLSAIDVEAAYIAVNADRAVLGACRADVKLWIDDALDEAAMGAYCCGRTIVVACLGAATGSGVAPVVARIARRLGSETGAVITKPFLFEGKAVQERYRVAREALSMDRMIEVPMWDVLARCPRAKSLPESYRAGDAVVGLAVEAMMRPPSERDDWLSLAG
jgi:cell division protein FtsZ